MKPITDRVDEIREHGLMRTFYPLPKEFEEIETEILMMEMVDLKNTSSRIKMNIQQKNI